MAAISWSRRAIRPSGFGGDDPVGARALVAGRVDQDPLGGVPRVRDQDRGRLRVEHLHAPEQPRTSTSRPT